MALRTTTLVWALGLALLVGTVVWVLRPARTADQIAADGLARTLISLASQSGDTADIYLTSSQAELLKSLCSIMDNALAAPAAAEACPPCPESPAADGGADDLNELADADLVEECPVCSRCPPPVLPPFSMSIPFLHWNPHQTDTMGVIFVLEANAPPVEGESARSIDELSQQLLRSVQSLKQFSPSLNYMLATDQVELSTDLTDAFPRTITLDEAVPLHGMQKVKALLNSPFQRTLLIEPGIVFCHDITGVFQFVDNFDLAAPFVRDDLLFQSVRTQQAHHLFLLLREQHSSAFSSSMLVVKRSQRTERLLQEWLVSMTRTMARSADFWLARLLPKSDVRFIALPTEYGLVPNQGSRLPISLMGTVVAFRANNVTERIQLTCEIINQATEPRVFFPDRSDINTITALSLTYTTQNEQLGLSKGDSLAAEVRRGDHDIIPIDDRMRAGARAAKFTLAPLSHRKHDLSRELDELLRDQGDAP